MIPRSTDCHNWVIISFLLGVLTRPLKNACARFSGAMVYGFIVPDNVCSNTAILSINFSYALSALSVFSVLVRPPAFLVPCYFQ